MASFKVLLLVMAVACVGCASAKQFDDGPIRFKMVEFSNPSTQFIPGFNFGSQSYFRNPLKDIHTLQQVGVSISIREETVAIDLSTGAYELYCTFSIVFGDNSGTLVLAGQFVGSPSDLAIVGGTGAYTGASGIAHQNTISANPGTVEFVFGYNLEFYVMPRITLPDSALPTSALPAGVPPLNGACTSETYPDSVLRFQQRGFHLPRCSGSCPSHQNATPSCT